MMGGQLTVTSEVGRGSTFTAEVRVGATTGERIRQDDLSQLLQVDDATVQQVTQLASARVLLADDGESNRRLIELVLGRAGATVVGVEDGAHAVELALKESYDVILMDMQMPVMDGYTAAGQLRRAGLTVPIVAMTAHAMKEDEQKCLAAGCSHFLPKPVDVDALLALMAQLIGTRDPDAAPLPPVARSGHKTDLVLPSGSETAQSPSDADLPAHVRCSLPLDDADFYDIAEEFVARLQEQLREMALTLWNNDFAELARSAHWLKGAGGTAGFADFTAPARRLEVARQTKTARRMRIGVGCSAATLRTSRPPDPAGSGRRRSTLQRRARWAGPRMGRATRDSAGGLRGEPIEMTTAMPVSTTFTPTGPDAPPTVPASETAAPSEQVTSQKIAIVDDEPINIKITRKFLQKAGYQDFVTTTESTEAFEMIVRERPDIIMLDVVMPKICGLDILEQLRHDRRTATVPVLILTASTEPAIKVRALELGATDFLAKPVDPSDLLPRVRNALVIKAHQDHLQRYAERLEEEVRVRTEELALSRREIIECLARAAEYRDETTGHHIVRVGKYAALLATEVGLDKDQVELIEQAAQLHDVGKIGIPDVILRKPGKLDPEEFSFMKRHCAYGQKILQRMSDREFEEAQRADPKLWQVKLQRSSSLVELAAVIALSHHEWWNGKGYPNGLSGENIPLVGRITAVADVYDALSSPRAYKPAYTHEACVAMIKDGTGRQFDPRIADCFLKVQGEFDKIRVRFGD